jgi:hypothetical protein
MCRTHGGSAPDFAYTLRDGQQMNIPKFWERAVGDAQAPDGSPVELIAWGWSHEGRDEARGRAADRLRKMIARVRSGERLTRYPYATGALREEIVEEVVDSGGETLGLITRNAYGALVLNVRDVMFIDVDLPAPPSGQFLRRLFGGESSAAAANRILERVKTALRNTSDATFRIYRTAAGFRLLASSRSFDPLSSEAEKVMAAVGADPSYVQLCRAQKSFRARLTPKPWRCACPDPPGKHPRDEESQQRFLRWLTQYETKCAQKRVCEYVDQVGGAPVAERVGPLVRLHDEMTRVHAALPLA